MDLVVIPHALMVFYGALVLGCGGVVGFIAGRNVTKRRRVPSPPTPELLERRVALLEQELQTSQGELKRIIEEREFMRELREPPPRHGLHLEDLKRFVA